METHLFGLMPRRNRVVVLSALAALIAFVDVSAIVRAAPVRVCSFNVQWMGSSDRRRNSTLAKIVKDYDIVVIQELVAPPFPGTFPDGTPFKPDPESGAFFGAMRSFGFEYVLSEEDTGTNPKIHVNSSATEWYVTFYKPDRVRPAIDLPHGFLAKQRGDHNDFERVPYAFPFRTTDDKLDFVLISVHLQPNAGKKAANRRRHELQAIADWIAANDGVEHDFIILGDMNIESAAELQTATPSGFVSLNDECRQTNTNQRPGTGRPYDHIMFRPAQSTEIDTGFDMKVIDLIKKTKGTWKDKDGAFPGDPYNHDRFRAHFSDHHPVEFRIKVLAQDDD